VICTVTGAGFIWHTRTNLKEDEDTAASPAQPARENAGV